MVDNLFRVLHTADWHVCDKNIDEAKKCLEFFVEAAKTEKPDVVIISGDIYDSESVKLDSLSAKLIFKIVADIADIAPVAIVTGTKSHDGTASEALKYIKARNEVFVSTMPEQIYLMPGGFFVTNPGDTFPTLTISQVPTPSKQYFNSSGSIDDTNQEIASKMSGIFAGFGAKAQKYDCPHVVSGHFSVSGAFLSATRQMVGFDVEISSDQISLANAGLVALGHIHLKQQIKKTIFYSGSLFQGDASEAGQDFGFWIHELDAANGLQESKYIITPFTHLYALKLDFTDPQTDFRTPFTQKIKDNIKDAVVKVEIRVFEDDIAKIDHEDLERNLATAKSYEIKTIRVPRENVRSENLLKMTTLREKLIELARLRGEEVPESILLKADNLEYMAQEQVVEIAGA